MLEICVCIGIKCQKLSQDPFFNARVTLRRIRRTYMCLKYDIMDLHCGLTNNYTYQFTGAPHRVTLSLSTVICESLGSLLTPC